MKIVGQFIRVVHGLMALLFAAAAIVLLGIALNKGREAILGGLTQAAAQKIIEAVALLTAAVVAL